MRYMKHVQDAAISKFEAFCKHCTLHGFYYFSDRRHWTVYVLWSAIITASLALCTFLSLMIWDKFVDDPTFTVVESTHYSTTKIPFPAVTICDTEEVYGPNTHNITDILESRGFNQFEIEAFYASFTGKSLKNYTPSESVKKMHKILHDLEYSNDVLLDMFAKPCEVLMVNCLWRSEYHNCTDMFRKVHTIVGYCCQFDMAYFKKHADPQTNFLPGIDPNEALGVVINGQKVSFRGTAVDGYVQMYIHDHLNSVTLVDPATTLTPAGYFDTNIYVWAIDSSRDVRTLSLNSRKCLLDTDLLDTGSFYEECMTILILREVVDYCRCLPFHFTASKLGVEEFSNCTWDRLLCIDQTIARVKSNIGSLISDNECLQKCDRVQYETEIEYIGHKRQYGNRNGNYSHIVVHFSSTTCLKYRREVLYAWDQMLANLGGIFGLCLGGSIISLIELIWFIADLMYNLYLSITKKKTIPLNKNNIYTVSTGHLPKEKIVKFKFVN